MNAFGESGKIAEVPLGWNYNPASWSQRLPVTVLALAGFTLSTWFALYAPVGFSPLLSFLTFSPRFHFVSLNLRRLVPSPEMGFSAFGFLLQIVGSLVGNTRRWRIRPYWVVALGLALLLLAAFNVSQTALECVFTDRWCLAPLLAAIISILMIGPAMDEVLASLQHFKRTRHANKHKWLFFWNRHSLIRLDH